MEQSLRPIFDAAPEELAAWCVAAGEKPFRAKQIRAWLAERRAESFEQMTDLSAAFRAQLAAAWRPFGAEVVAAPQDVDSGAGKLALKLADGRMVECVLLVEDDRRTVCLSTQVGCAMACVFCASGLDGVERNLTPGEMIEQLLLCRNRLAPGERLTHIVVMGMGEPLANLENLLAALAFATAPAGLGISARHITISTVGLPAKIRRLAALDKRFHLAVSLHAPNAELRRRIVPTAERIDFADILAAADEYRSATGRQITFEYVMLAGVNDALEHAGQLARLLRGRDAFVNLIPFNPVPGLPWHAPEMDHVQRFANVLRDHGVPVKTRKRKGQAIDAACGQLRRRLVAAPAAAQLIEAIPFESKG
jgi:23S rRNA (adenine2503-C2)-methyltransferase